MRPLLELYTRWGVLTQAESEAIRARDWGALSQLQSEKQALTDDIARLSGPERRGAGGNAANQIKPLLEHLVRLESENVATLAGQIRCWPFRADY